MTKLLTQRALRVFAVLEGYRAGSPDILDALLPFFEPILAEFPGQTLDPDVIAERVREAYRWNFTPDIVEELIPRFESRKWVEAISRTQHQTTYRIVYNNPNAAPPAAHELQIEKTLLEIALHFREFIERISPLTAFSKTPIELSEILVEWLVSIDAYTEDVLRQRVIQTTYTAGQIGLAIVLPDAGTLPSEERYLCARFVKFLFETKSPYIADLCKLASVGLLTEVIQDFHKPVTQVSKTNLAIYLDAPVALDLLGVSGKAAAANIRPIVKKLQQIGASVRIFRVSVNELSRALEAVLRRTPPDRTGPTADAMRRGEALEAYVRQVARDPDSALAEHNIGVIDRKLEQFPNEHEYFSKRQYEDFFSRMTWHVEMTRREHDATIIAQVMRMRRGSKSRDIFQTQHIIVTRNALLAQLGRRYCIDEDMISTNSVGPAIHQRQLATAIWLRTGLSNGDGDIPRSYLLAACERVLELKKNVVDHVRILARNLTQEKAEQLDLLLTQDRSVQILMDKTLGTSNVLSASNVDGLIDEMKQSLAEEAKAKATAEIASTKKEAAKNVRKAHKARRLAEKRADEIEASLSSISAEDEKVVEQLISEVNAQLRRRRRIAKFGIALLVLLVGALPLFTESISGVFKIAALILSGLIAAVFAFLQVLDRPIGLDGRLAKWGLNRLVRLAIQRGIKPKLDRFTVLHDNGRLELARPSIPGADRLAV